ncbi:response regulator [Jeotgalibaca sp. MA1X17-3]|uniref:response regulator transcription factor n=1 Tax=Jeotgalibaca sp. MA1X17-3 TaxID=2908211 RepID=UPI001F182F6C|nr:response regulator [Jeotgalibaca sp. MA1X17-3]UJF16723.1 response regulator [Jeotgalibaca sp. MA1X17-3]
MIVDDEKYVVEYLKNLINWLRYGFTSVRTFHNSIIAKEEIERDAPDLLISDIRMPEISGIDLLKTVFQKKLPTQVIFLSGHSEFEYAQKAIHYGASDYLLKPVVKNKLIEAVETIISEIETEEMEIRNKSGQNGLPEDFYRSMEAVLRMFLKEESEGRRKDSFGGLLIKEPLLFCKVPFSIFNKEIYEGSIDAASISDFYNTGYQWEATNEYIGLIPAHALESFLELNPYEDVKFSEEFIIKEEVGLKERYKDFFGRTLGDCESKHIESSEEAKEENRIAQINQDSEKVESKEEKDNNQAVIQAINTYIEENLNEGLSLEDLSKIVYFHPAYLSRFYKQVTGQKLSDYIVKRRLIRAKELLKESNLRVGDIANLVGYKKSQYFIKVFKINCGVTPNQYRRKIIEGGE